MSSDLVGRDAEQHQIRRLLDHVRAGRTQFLLVTGEPGIGKSALVFEATRSLPTVRYHHREPDSVVPLGAVRQIVSLSSPDPQEPGESQLDIALQISELLEGIETASVVLIEDVHWIDQASQEVLWHIVSRLDDIDCLFVFTSRTTTDWFSNRLAKLLSVGDLGAHIALRPLSPAAVGEYVRNELQLPLSNDQRDKIMTASGGIPLYLEALVARLEHSRLRTDTLAQAIEGLSSSAEELDDSLRKQVAGLADDQAEALLAVALDGPLTEAQLTQVVDERGLGELDLAALRRTGLLSPGPAISFRHQSLADSLASLFSAAQIRDTHRSLAKLTTGLDNLMHRVAAQREGDDPELLGDLLTALLSAAISGDLETGHLLAAWAAQVDPNMLPIACLMTFRARRPGLLTRHQSEIRAMLPSPTRQVLLGALEVVTTGQEPVELADRRLLDTDDETVLLLLGHTYSELGRLRSAAAQFTMPRMLDLVRQRIDGYLTEQELPAERQVEFNALSAVLRLWWIFSDHHDEPRRATAEFLTMADELRDVPGAETVSFRALQIAASLQTYLATNGEAVRLLDELIERDPAAEHDLSLAAVNFRLNFLGGRWDAAQLINEPALARALEGMTEVDSLRAQALSAVIPLCRGEEELGRRTLARVRRQDSSTFNASSATADWGLGWVAALNGDPRAVVEHFDQFWGQFVTAVFSGVSTGLLRARALAALGDRSAAVAAHQALMRMPLAEPTRRYFADHGEAVLAALDGHHAEADGLYRTARTHLEALIADTELGWLLFRSLLAEDHARLLIAAPEMVRTADEAAVDGAITLAMRLGAKTWRARLEALRANLPSAPRTAPSPVNASPVGADQYESLAQLTSREREITLLLLSGVSNREIAERLFLSVRTVEYHVRNSLHKLGVQSRVQLREMLGPLSAG